MFYVVDLFAGCGGLSEGFRQAGFSTIADIDMDFWACETLKTRHLFHELRKIKKLHLYNEYVKDKISREAIFRLYPNISESISQRVIKATLGNDPMDKVLERIKSSLVYHGGSKVNVLIGGPPCQPYSLVGRARDPNKMKLDGRHFLYRHYLTILNDLKPDFFVYENVPGLFSAEVGGERIFSKLQQDFDQLDTPYEIIPPLNKVREQPGSYVLNSSDFGVPEHRKRLILIGYRKSLKQWYPNLENIFGKLQKKATKNNKLKALTVRDAIEDLPGLKPGEGNDRYLRRYETRLRLSEYQKKMRFCSCGILNHRARTQMGTDLKRYQFFIEHQEYGNHSAKLHNLLIERPDLKPNHANLLDFDDRFKVQSWDFPSSTIMAHISKDGHYYIHPDINQCRSFTVREAARCQSFPDNYLFEGPRTEQFKQVGNAVPPELAYQVASVIKKELTIIYGK